MAQEATARPHLAERRPYGRVVSVDIVDGRLQCVVEVFASGRYPPASKAAQKVAEHFHEMLLSCLPRIRREVAAVPVERGTPGDWHAVAVDVRLVVFAHLDTLTQTRLRAVCSAWNALLDAPVLTANLLIQTRASIKSVRNPRHFALAAPIFKCLRSTTKRLILVDRHHGFRGNTRDFFAVADTIHYVARSHPGMRLTALYVVGGTHFLPEMAYLDFEEGKTYNLTYCDMHNPKYVPRPLRTDLEEFIAASRGLPCETVCLVHCAVRLRCDVRYWPHTYFQREFPVLIARLPLSSRDWASTVWEALEAALSAPSDDEVRTLAEWLAVIAVEQKKEYQRRAVCRALCVTQTADPRPSAHYRGKQWCTDGLQDLRLEKLSRTALRFLLLLPGFLRHANDKLRLEEVELP